MTGKKETAGDYVLVPLVDSMNHVTTAKTDLSFSPVSGELGVSVERCGGTLGRRDRSCYGTFPFLPDVPILRCADGLLLAL